MILFYRNSHRKMLSKQGVPYLWRETMRLVNGWIVVLGGMAMAGCSPIDYSNSSYDPYSSSGYGSSYDYDPTYYDHYSSSRYPSQGYEQTYRQERATIYSQNTQAIMDGIKRQMLSRGWYPEAVSRTSALFTYARN